MNIPLVNSKHRMHFDIFIASLSRTFFSILRFILLLFTLSSIDGRICLFPSCFALPSSADISSTSSRLSLAPTTDNLYASAAVLEQVLLRHLGVVKSVMQSDIDHVPDHMFYLHERHRSGDVVDVDGVTLHMKHVRSIRMHQHTDTGQDVSDDIFSVPFDIGQLQHALAVSNEFLIAAELRLHTEISMSNLSTISLHLHSGNLSEWMDSERTKYIKEIDIPSLAHNGFWITVDVTELLEQFLTVNHVGGNGSIYSTNLTLHLSFHHFHETPSPQWNKSSIKIRRRRDADIEKPNSIEKKTWPQLITYTGDMASKDYRRTQRKRRSIRGGQKTPRTGNKNQNKFVPSSQSTPRQNSNHVRRSSIEEYHSPESILTSIQQKSQHCSRHHLTVNFEHINWHKWVIAPKQYEAGFCAGSCPFPLSDFWNTTNHAIIQHVLHGSRRHGHIPPPLCVPITLASESLMYYESDGTVKVTKFDNMVVKNCGCR